MLLYGSLWATLSETCLLCGARCWTNIAPAMTPQPFKFVINGQKVELASLEDAAALLGAMNKAQEVAAPGAKPAAAVTPEVPKTANGGSSEEVREGDLDPRAIQMALSFLKAIREGGSKGGIESDAVMAAMGVTAKKAIGSKSGKVNGLLESLGMRQKSVYNNPKTAAGRFWKPGKKIDEAIQRLEQRLAAAS